MTIVARTGHMAPQEVDKDGNVTKEAEYVQDSVTVLVVEPGGWSTKAKGEDEEKARERGREIIEGEKEVMRQQIAEAVAAGRLTQEKAHQFRKDAKL